MRLVRRALCHLDGSGIKEGARSLEPRFYVGKGEPGRLEIRDGLAELLAVPRIGDRLVKTALSAAERACADIDPSAVETGHGDLEAVAFLAQPVFDRHPHSVQIDLRGRLRMPAELLLLRAEGDARHEIGRAHV